MTPIVSLYTVIASMIGALALVSLVVRQLLKGRPALGWLSLALLGGLATTFIYSSGGSSPQAMAALATGDTLSVACACFAIRAALDQPAIPARAILLTVALLGVSIVLFLVGVGFPFLAAIPFQLGMGLLLANTVVTASRSLRGLAEWSMLVGISLNMLAYAVRLPFWPSLMDSGRAYPSAASDWLNLVMLLSSTVFVPLVVLGIIGREIGWLVGDYRDRSERDGLTGLSHRQSLECRLAAARAKTGVLILADIDHFKAINDRYGHGVGDRVIVAFAGILAEARGIAARVGGEEFALAMPGATIEQAHAEAEAMRRLFHDLAPDGIDADHFLSASFGIAAYERGQPFAQVFTQADAALYEAKARGRNMTVLAHFAPSNSDEVPTTARPA